MHKIPFDTLCLPSCKQDVKHQLKQLSNNARLAAFIAPFAAASSDSLTAVYTRTFERAAFGFAKVCSEKCQGNEGHMKNVTDRPIRFLSLQMYLFLLFMRVLLSWFPSIDWNSNPWTFLRLVRDDSAILEGRSFSHHQSVTSHPSCLSLQITEPYLQIYRGILPPLFGQLDFTPLFGFLILQDVVEVMAPTYTMGMHAGDTSTRWTTSDVMCYFDGF
jgi:uncharacterized protein YggT (Ycf19 family)